MTPGRSRWAVSAIFFINGVVVASWVPHIPAVKAKHALSDGTLGAVLLCMALGAVLALFPAGWLTARVGSHRSTTFAALGLCIALPLPVVSPSIPLQAPRRISDTDRSEMLGLTTGRGRARLSPRAANVVARWLPTRAVSQPASGSASTAPSAMHSSTAPSVPSLKAWFALTAGM